MNDELTAPDEPTGSTQTLEPTGPSTKRRGVRWYHVVVLGAAVLVCAAAVGFFVHQTSERDDATAQRIDAQAHLAQQRRDTEGARHDLAAERSQTKTALADVATITTSLHEFSDLVAQAVDQDGQVQSVATRLPDSVDEFNSTVDQANALGQQIRDKADAIQQQINSIRGKVDAQLAAALR